MKLFTRRPRHRKQGHPTERALADILEHVGLRQDTHPKRSTWAAQPAPTSTGAVTECPA